MLSSLIQQVVNLADRDRQLVKRDTSICPDCKKNPKGFTRGGKQMPYCNQCSAAQSRQRYLKRTNKKKEEQHDKQN